MVEEQIIPHLPLLGSEGATTQKTDKTTPQELFLCSFKHIYNNKKCLEPFSYFSQKCILQPLVSEELSIGNAYEGYALI